MIVPGDKALVAVSGGMDSVALLHLLNRFKGEYGFDLAVAHLNHMARGEDSDSDARFVASLGKELGLETIVRSVDVQKEKGNFKTSFQETARILRYRFLDSALQEVGGSKIAIGHTADDQVETVLMNFLRGSGLKGLSGMPEERGNIIRPLYDCYRSEVEAFIRSGGYAFCPDATNTQTHYLRNRIRLDLIPQLEGYNPDFKSNIMETSRIIRADENYLEEQAGALYRKLVQSLKEGEGLLFKRDDFLKLAPALQNRLLRLAVFSVKGDLRRLSAVHIREILGLFTAPRPEKRTLLPGGLTVVCAGENVEFRKTPDSPLSILKMSPDGGEVTELKIPGLTEMAAADIRFQVKLLSRENRPGLPGLPNQACMDFDKTGGRILARFFKPGDRFVPLGMKGSKKLKSFFIDRKIPRTRRKTIPILTTGSGDIIWIYGQRISETYRVTDKTRNIILIEGVGGSEHVV